MSRDLSVIEKSPERSSVQNWEPGAQVQKNTTLLEFSHRGTPQLGSLASGASASVALTGLRRPGRSLTGGPGLSVARRKKGGIFPLPRLSFERATRAVVAIGADSQ